MNEDCTNPTPYAVASTVLPGLAKMAQESAELTHVIMRIMEVGGMDHWRGNQRQNLLDEMADVLAAIKYFGHRNLTYGERLNLEANSLTKFTKTLEWERTHNFQPGD